MHNRLQGRVALVTGAAQGIGLASADRLRSEGATLILADVQRQSVTAAAERLDVEGQALDVADWPQWEALGDHIRKRYGRLDILVSNAGIAAPGRIEDMNLDLYRRITAVNQDGTFFGMRMAIPLMRAAGGGSIVNLSSIDGMIGAGGLSAYVASKFAVRGLTRSAAIELADDGIRVNAVLPGVIETPLSASGVASGKIASIVARQPLKRLGTPAEVAALIAFLASDEAAYCTGGEYLVDGGQLAGPVRD